MNSNRCSTPQRTRRLSIHIETMRTLTHNPDSLYSYPISRVKEAQDGRPVCNEAPEWLGRKGRRRTAPVACIRPSAPPSKPPNRLCAISAAERSASRARTDDGAIRTLSRRVTIPCLLGTRSPERETRTSKLRSSDRATRQRQSGHQHRGRADHHRREKVRTSALDCLCSRTAQVACKMPQFGNPCAKSL